MTFDPSHMTNETLDLDKLIARLRTGPVQDGKGIVNVAETYFIMRDAAVALARTPDAGLRKALEEIATYWDHLHPDARPDDAMVNIAREALSAVPKVDAPLNNLTALFAIAAECARNREASIDLLERTVEEIVAGRQT